MKALHGLKLFITDELQAMHITSQMKKLQFHCINLNSNSMVNSNDASFMAEQNEFYSDKCGYCMEYVGHDDECTNTFCEGRWPEGRN